MLNELTINGKNYVPAIEAGRKFEYTKGYILLLIKEGKIDGKKVGHRWYVHLPSTQEYFDTAKEKRVDKRKQVSDVRKAELVKYTEIQTVNLKSSALVETLVIFVIGLSIGVVGYLGTESQEPSAASANNFVKSFAISFYESIASSASQINSKTASPLTGETISSQIGTSTITSVIVAPDEIFSATSIESISRSFSDEVEISQDQTNARTGIITPIFKNTQSETYRFLMVPVTPPNPAL